MEKQTANTGTKDIKVFSPFDLQNAEEILIFMQTNPLIVNFENLKQNKKQRFLDLLTGGAVALNKGICVLDKNNFLILDK